MYLVVQKALFIPLTALPGIVVLCLLYVYGKRPLVGTQTFGDRMEYLYSFSAAMLLGQFLFQALPNATGPVGPQLGAFVSLFVLVGFFIMLCAQKYQRVAHTNPLYVAPEGTSVEIVSILNRQSMEIVEFYHAIDLEATTAPDDRFQLMDETAELRKRVRVTTVAVGVLSILCLLEGIFLVYRPHTWFTWGFFLLDKLLETVVVGVAMLHALFHATTERQMRRYLYYSIGWILVSSCSSIPAIADMDYLTAYAIVNHIATSIFYALAGGILFWVALYYIWIDRKRVNRRQTVIRLAIFGVSGGIMWAVGFFF